LTDDGAPHEDKRSIDMDAYVKKVVREMSEASDEERITFPEVVKALTEVGIERYHADLVAGRKTYYLPDGDFEEVEVHKAGGAAMKFSAEGVERSAPSSGRRSLIANSAAGSRTRAASAISSVSRDAAPSITAAPATSMSNGFPAPSHDGAGTHGPADQGLATPRTRPSDTGGK
jgi:hypothetical protein